MSLNDLRHLAVIMDGNGRWAQNRNHHRIFGHVRGAKKARELVEACSQKKISFLTLFTFSRENAQRPREEVLVLFRLLEKALLKHSSLLKKLKIRLHTLGDISYFPEKILESLESLKTETKNHKGLNLILALNYGGQQEILNGVKELSLNVEKGQIKAKNINKPLFEKYLPSCSFPSPDLIIRTGGQTRLSNFYLWPSIYSEFYFTSVLWPDFTKKDLNLALEKFANTKRRFGKL